MIIKNARAGLLSNFEVLQLLNEQQEFQRATQEKDASIEYPENLRTIQFELTEYLNQSPCSTQDEAQVKSFLDAFSKYDLMLAEKLQILNLRPKSPVELYLLIEECEERFGEQELEEMLQSILDLLPRDDDYVEEEGEDEMQEGE
ncbi:HRDC-like protein [Dichotomocladium elegans]|nr:HRDC-like protein [Dichotomocladium elegans]